MNDVRCSAVDLSYWNASGRWAIFALNLMGDPEMWGVAHSPLYAVRQDLWNGDLRIPLRVQVRPPKPVPPRPPEPLEWLRDVVVHLRQDDFERTDRPGEDGAASFNMLEALPGKLTLTVSHPDLAPFVQELDAHGPLWLTGIVTCVTRPRGADGDASIVLETTGGTRTFTVRTDVPTSSEVVNAASAAWAAERSIPLLVERGEDEASAIGFRLCNNA